MLKFLKRALILFVVLAIAFIAISIYSGGDQFRWVGNIFKKGTDEAAETADLIKDTSEKVTGNVKKTGSKIKDTSKKVTRDMKNTGSKIKDTTEEATKAVKDTGEKIKKLTGSDD
jgi:gas vesicle protein